MSNLEILQSQYLDLINNQLPSIAINRHFPVRLNHCFGRILLDNLFGGVWYNYLSRKTPAYKQLTEKQLEDAICIAQNMMYDSGRAIGNRIINNLNDNSLRWREAWRESLRQ